MTRATGRATNVLTALFCLVAWLPAVAQTGRRSAAPCTVASPTLPTSVHLPAALLPAVQTMLGESPTFRGQCRRLAHTSELYIRVRLVPSLPDPRFRGVTVIQRTRSGVLVAFVDLLDGIDQTEWIAHELEHVIEQIDGVRVKEQCGRHPRLCRSASGAFDTARAVRVGQAVQEEVARGRALHARPPTVPALRAAQ